MKKIYYFQKHEVKLGDIIEYNGLKTLVTKELIELNPELFSVEDYTQPMYFKCVKGEGDYTKDRIYKQNYSTYYPTAISLISNKGILEHLVYWQSAYIKQSRKCFELTTKEEWDKQNLLDDAKRRYPIGTVLNDVFGEMFTVPKEPSYSIGKHGSALINNVYVYRDGRWAEVLPLKFTTEDGVKIYGDMKTFLIHPNDSANIDFSHSSWYGNSECKGYKYFYHKENALAYIEKHKEKTLEEYENILIKSKSFRMVDKDGIETILETRHFYQYLKEIDPKLYYTKILQLIADDLNGGRYIHIRGNTSYHLSNARGVNVHCGGDEGCVYFKSRELAEKARVILGGKLDCLLN